MVGGHNPLDSIDLQGRLAAIVCREHSQPITHATKKPQAMTARGIKEGVVGRTGERMASERERLCRKPIVDDGMIFPDYRRGRQGRGGWGKHLKCHLVECRSSSDV